jgi:CDP-glycerol glycerophosphotransferase (TagB/SpsB family)
LISNKFNSNDKHTILWLPRWTEGKFINGQKESHFLKYYKQFIEYANKNPDMNLIIRPHPLMFGNFVDKGIMSQDEVDVFKRTCRESHNIELDESKDYFASFGKAGILVADYTSLIAEYFVTGNPVIYCDDVDGLSTEAHLMDSAFYHADNFEQVKENIEKLCNGVDSLVSLREKVRKEIIPANAGYVGVEIINTIIQDYNKGK